jgi:hypothetical protein
MIEQQAKSTPRDVLIAQILDYRTPKNEREWAANFELHKLKAENEVMKWGLQSLQKLLNIFATITPEDHRHFELILKGILAKSVRINGE